MKNKKADEYFEKTWEEYNNSDDLDFDIICVLLATGRRKPKNSEEQKILDGINEQKSRGIAVEFPFN